MRVAVIGRTEMLLNAAKAVAEAGHEIGLVCTRRAAEYYSADAKSYADFAQAVGAPFIEKGRLTDPAVMDVVRATACEVAISMNWPGILTDDFLSAFPHGVFNAHPGNLPRYRGNACPNWAMLRGEAFASLAIHRMVEELDAGPIAFLEHFPLSAETYIGDVYDWLHLRVPALFTELVEALAHERLSLTPQDQGIPPLRVFPRRPEDSRIDWRQSAEQICRLVRASSRPFAGAYTSYEGDSKVVIWKASQYDPSFEFMAIPGQVALRVDGKPVIACGHGMVILDEIECDGTESPEAALNRVAANLRGRLL